ncbi:MAG: sulfotransferase family 2 domain-containing protein [Hellea sp.]|nr:sulfotransferase family 2 domain-containing protein [Hellea sp.]
MAERAVIIHYHLFKNAGSSVDEILRHNFGDQWVEIEGPDNKKLTPDMMADYIVKNPDIKVISSHTAQITLPKIKGVKIIPIVFMRHPIARIQSAYEFERNQESDQPGAKAAKDGDFKHYMAWRLSTAMMNQIVNFHTVRLKDFVKFTTNREAHLFRQRAIQAVKQLPMVGLVEKFDESMAKYAELIRPYFPEFKVIAAHANTRGAPKKSLQGKLKAFEEEIGRLSYINLVQLNAIDLDLYHFVQKNLWSE